MKRTVDSAIRSVKTVAECPRLTKFSLHAPKAVEVEFDNGSAYSLSAEYLRICSQQSTVRLDQSEDNLSLDQVISGRRHVGIMSAEPVGNYGVRLLFDDLHKTGIFTWDYFYHLGSNKFSLMRNYIQTLKKHGLSRDPHGRSDFSLQDAELHAVKGMNMH
ncbi:UNVERIFIED_CONTAM: hypothetical protein Scaly_2091800 [Sesamum calycinum]|uniref:Gamma-butyrobetaine hydroxylase-like N-terminal domain-containing protein n=1 Tax=Sesamum calycinum TaxID=2727403 RepID=A0AAW2MM91_9LAMI